LTIIGGKFAGLAGSETVSDVANSNVSRSPLYSLQPVTLTGVRGGYKFNDMTAPYVGVSNSVMVSRRTTTSRRPSNQA